MDDQAQAINERAFIVQPRGKPGKNRSPGGAIIKSKIKHIGRYEFQENMPPHGQQYLKEASNLACFPCTPWKSNGQHGVQVVIMARRRDGLKTKHQHRSPNSMTTPINATSQEGRIKIKTIGKNKRLEKVTYLSVSKYSDQNHFTPIGSTFIRVWVLPHPESKDVLE